MFLLHVFGQRDAVAEDFSANRTPPAFCVVGIDDGHDIESAIKKEVPAPILYCTIGKPPNRKGQKDVANLTLSASTSSVHLYLNSFLRLFRFLLIQRDLEDAV